MNTKIIIRYIAAAIILVPAGIFDLRKKKIPTALLIAPITVAAIWDTAACVNGNVQIIELTFAVMPGVFLLLSSYITGRKVGNGDGGVFILMGLLIGAPGAFMLLGLSLILCAIASGILLVAHKAKKNSRIPFVPFVLAAFGGVMYAQILSL